MQQKQLWTHHPQLCRTSQQDNCDPGITDMEDDV